MSTNSSAAASPSGISLDRVIQKTTAVSKITLVLMIIPIVIDITLRTFFSSYLPGSFEIEELLMSIMVVTALANPQIDGGHISVDLMVRKWGATARATLDLFVWGTSALFASVLAWRFFALAAAKYLSAEYSAEMHIPYWPFQALGGMGSALLALAIFRDAIRALQRLREARHNFGICLALGGIAFLACLPGLIKMTPLMDNLGLLGGLGMCLLMLMILLSVPIGFAMGIVGMLGMLTIHDSTTSAFSMMGMSAFHTSSTYTYTVVPMFIFMGTLAYQANISRDLFSSATVWLGRMPGGLMVASIAGCAGFAAVCGDSLATAVTMGSVSLPEMRKKGYDLGLGCAALAAGGTLGILIPPSIGFIFYAIITEESIARLFIAGILPGILLTSLFMGIVILFALRYPHLAPRGERSTWKEKIISTKGVLPILFLLVFVLAGILTGFFTPTEGGAMGAACTLAIALLQRRMTWERFLAALDETLSVTSRIMVILIAVHLLGFFFASTRLPNALATFAVSLNANKWVVFAIVVVFYIIMGCLMNIIPIMLLTLPAIYPTIADLGFDPIWFGVVTVILMEMGQITPPVGVNVFAISTLAKDVPMEKIFKHVLPMFMAMLVCIIILCFFPQIALWLPNLLMN